MEDGSGREAPTEQVNVKAPSSFRVHCPPAVVAGGAVTGRRQVRTRPQTVVGCLPGSLVSVLLQDNTVIM